MSDTQIQPDYPRGLNFEQVWAAIMESRKEFDQRMKEADERRKETDRQMKETDERMKETDERMKETDQRMKETDRQMKEFNKRFGDFTNRFGEIVEYMVAPGLQKKFMELGFNFQRVNNESKFTDSNRNFLFAVDIMLENSQSAMLVEVKSKLNTEDVSDHVERLEKMREYADSHDDKRIFYGAVAGAITPPNVKKFALSKGFFVIEPSGETFNITSPDNNPKEW